MQSLAELAALLRRRIAQIFVTFEAGIGAEPDALLVGVADSAQRLQHGIGAFAERSFVFIELVRFRLNLVMLGRPGFRRQIKIA